MISSSDQDHHIVSARIAAGTVLVAGATGTVGSDVVRQLLGVGIRPRALVRDISASRRRFGEQIDEVSGDLDDPRSIEAALEGVDRLFLLTRQTERQLIQERTLIAAARRTGVSRVVKISVFRADEHSPLQIARQHWHAEQALRDSGLRHTVLRPVFFMQNLFSMIRPGLIGTGAGDGRVAMIDARDVAAAAVAALVVLPADGQVHTLTGPAALTFDQVADILSRRTGDIVRHVRVGPDAVRDRILAIGGEPWFAKDMATLHGMLADGYEDVVDPDLTGMIGAPPRTVERFVADFSDRLGTRLANSTVAERSG